MLISNFLWIKVWIPTANLLTLSWFFFFLGIMPVYSRTSFSFIKAFEFSAPPHFRKRSINSGALTKTKSIYLSSIYLHFICNNIKYRFLSIQKSYSKRAWNLCLWNCINYIFTTLSKPGFENVTSFYFGKITYWFYYRQLKKPAVGHPCFSMGLGGKRTSISVSHVCGIATTGEKKMKEKIKKKENDVNKRYRMRLKEACQT